MISLYKMIFDLSVYYTLAGFYLHLFAGTPASILGFALLCVSAGLCLLLRHKGAPQWCRYGALAIPAVGFLVVSGTWATVQMVLGWAYVVWCLRTGRLFVTYKEFRKQFLFGLRVQLACLPGLIVDSGGSAAALSSLPYLLILLVLGVCCLRCLREQESGLRYGIWVALLMGVCVLLNLCGVPNFLLMVFNWLYENVITFVIKSILMVLFLVFNFFLKIFADFTQFQSKHDGPPMGLESAPIEELLGVEGMMPDMSGKGQWLVVFGYVSVGVIAIGLIILIVVRLLNSMGDYKTPAVVYSQKTERIQTPVFQRVLRKPKDPRGLVRYYYALFLRECKARGMELSAGSTAQELAQQCAVCFPGANPDDLMLIYDPARYWSTQQVTAQQAEDAAQAWNRLRKTKYKAPKLK